MIARGALAVAIGLATVSIACPTHAQQPGAKPQAQDPARPKNPAANLPSDTGSQATMPSGAVTGAGQPQGKGVQPDVGAPGGLERRARARERAQGGDARGAGATPGGGAGAGTPESGARRTRAARDAKG